MRCWVLKQQGGVAWVRQDLACMTSEVGEAARFERLDDALRVADARNAVEGRVPVYAAEIDAETPAGGRSLLW